VARAAEAEAVMRAEVGVVVGVVVTSAAARAAGVMEAERAAERLAAKGPVRRVGLAAVASAAVVKAPRS